MPYPCCCRQPGPPTIIPCNSGTLLINPADYEIHLQFHSGSYVSECDSCNKLESTPFILTWDAAKSRWGYINATFGNSCSNRRRIDIGVSPACLDGTFGLRGKHTMKMECPSMAAGCFGV